MTRRNFLLALIGSAALLAYLAAAGLSDLRKNTIGFEVTAVAAFVLYLSAVALILRTPMHDTQERMRNASLWLIFAFAVLFRLSLLATQPTLSDDMYRYVWDGRVQAYGISPYRYPPNTPELLDLRRGDVTVWMYINRKDAITVYPPGAQLAFAALWRVVGDSVTGYKAAFTLAELLGGLLLIPLFRSLGLPLERLLIYWWSPLLIFEVSHAGHVDGLMLPLLIAAFWARVKERHWLLGIFLGAATLVKLFPVILLLALLPLSPWGEISEVSKDFRRLTFWLRPALKTLFGFGGVIALGYLPYALSDASTLGFLPKYFNENFNLGLARVLFDVAERFQLPKSTLANAVTFGGLVVLGIGFTLRPATSGRAALTRCVWLIGWFTLFTPNLFSWYLLWLLPLSVLLVEPGKLLGLKLAPMSAWLIFSGTSLFSYLFFIKWRVIPWAQAAEYWPLYALLLLSFAKDLWPRLTRRSGRWALRSSAAPGTFE